MAITLDEWLKNVVPYDSTPALPSSAGGTGGVTIDFAPALRTYVWGSAIVTVLSLIVLAILPSEQAIQNAGYFIVLRGTIAGTVGFFHEIAPLIAALDLAQLTVLAILCPMTEFFTRAELSRHWAAFGASVVGAFNGFVLSIMVGILLLNFVIWVVFVIIAIAICIAVLAAMANSSN